MTTGLLGSRKGISLPDTVLPFGSMTEKDRADLEYAMSLGVAWIAISFVQRAEDIAEARKLARGRSSIMAKIEKPSALNHLKAIIELADGIMVARGDLGVEMPVEKVPGLQKEITRAARNAGKPVVIATQMLESMIYAPAPTRAAWTFWPYSTAPLEIVRTFTWIGASHVGNRPAVFSMIEAMKRSKLPKIARWTTIGRFSALSASTYLRSNDTASDDSLARCRSIW
jgi:hypothetical protein